MTIAALVALNTTTHRSQTIDSLTHCPPITAMAAAVPSGMDVPRALHVIPVAAQWSKQGLVDALQWFKASGAEHLLFITGTAAPIIDTWSLQRMTRCMQETGASMVYGDFFDTDVSGTMKLHQLIDYHVGSIRDTFDFGSVILCSGSLVNKVLDEISSSMEEYSFGGWYDMRLRLSEKGPVYHMPEPLYYRIIDTEHDHHTAHFAYVDPRNRTYQVEMEQIVTRHLQRIGAFISPPNTLPRASADTFTVEASVIIPVRNRHKTIRDAVQSALAQKTSFPFNVIAVDNHSNDGTTEILAEIARTDSRLVHLIPNRTDLLIGGCWNEAIYSARCGTYAVQLDSDDLYDGTSVLERIVDVFKKGNCAMVIGSYTTVNFDLKLLPPGLIDHKEWSDTNGMNNALRIAGLGAPRAYHVPTLRQFGFPNTSYGEDYAVVLRMSRTYRVGRIYESLYWCRRWDENSDSKLSPETANRYDIFKDRLRSMEIAARICKDGCV